MTSYSVIKQTLSLLQLHVLQDALSFRLSALSYTNELLIVSSAVFVLGGLSIGLFYSDTESTAIMLTEINRANREIINEKIDVLSVDISATHLIFTLSNYGNKDTEIVKVLDSVLEPCDCISNNTDPTDFVIPINESMEVSCEINGGEPYYAVTDTTQILKVIP